MNEEKWMVFIDHYWSMMTFWEIINEYRTRELQGTFFCFSALATRNELLMRIAHSVKLCEEIAKKYDVGDEARASLSEIKALFAKGDTPDNSVLKFEDCGVKPFRDKILAHPLNQTKAVLGKPEYEISLNWATVEATLDKIKMFANQVEIHYFKTGHFTSGTYKGRMGAVEMSFRAITMAMEDAEKYNKLKQDIMSKGCATVMVDWGKDEIVIENQGFVNDRESKMTEQRTLTQQAIYALYDVDEMSKFKDLSELNNFVAFLSPDRQQELNRWLSEWRKNSVKHWIDGHRGSWAQELVEVERIIIAPINNSVNHLLARHQNRLHLIINDPEIVKHPEFECKGTINRATFLAERNGEDFRLKDGNHRAVILAVSGEKRIGLVYPL